MEKLKNLRIIFWGIVLPLVLLAVVLEITPALDGILPTGTTLEFAVQYIMIFYTLGTIFITLKLIKKKKTIRLIMLEAPTGLNLLLYHMFVNASFFYLAIMCFLAFPFLYPTIADVEETPNE